MRPPVHLLLLAVACAPAVSPTADDTDTHGASSSTTTAQPTTSTGAAPTTGAPTATTGPSATSDGTTDASTGEPIPSFCPGGTPLLQAPEYRAQAGLEYCPDSHQIHRYAAVECLHPIAQKPCPNPEDWCPEPCDAVGDGVCDNYYLNECTCTYRCVTDADCDPDAACLCASGALDETITYGGVPTSECVPANCHTDADCGGFFCALSPGLCNYPQIVGVFCHTADDECTQDFDCIQTDLGNLCMFDLDEQRWRCAHQPACE